MDSCPAVLASLAIMGCGTTGLGGGIDAWADAEDPVDLEDPAPDPCEEDWGDVLLVGECDRNVGVYEPHFAEAIAGDDWWMPTGAWELYGTVQDVPCEGSYFLVWVESRGALDDPPDDPSRGPKEPGTYTIDGPFSAYDCALCVYLEEGVLGSGEEVLTFRASSGILVIDEIELVDDCWITATITDLVLVEWDVEGDVPVPGGLTWCIDSWSVDQEMVHLV